MKHNPCPVCLVRNAIPTSARGFCARCEEVVKVIDYLVAEEQEAAERAAKRKASGIVLPEDIRKGRAR